MTPRTLVTAFAATVIAVVAGWFAGGAARDVWGDQYETAVGIVDTQVGIPVESATPTPTPFPTPTATREESPSPTPTETPSPSPSPTPVLTDDLGFCDGPPPSEGCDCDLQDGDWVWQCPLQPTVEPEEQD